MIASIMLGCAPQEENDSPGDAESELDYGLCSQFFFVPNGESSGRTGALRAMFAEVIENSGHGANAQIHNAEIVGENGARRFCADYSWRLDWLATRTSQCFEADADDDAQMRAAFEAHVVGWPDPGTALLDLDEVEMRMQECMDGSFAAYSPCRYGLPSVQVTGMVTEDIDECTLQIDTVVIDAVSGNMVRCTSAETLNCAWG